MSDSLHTDRDGRRVSVKVAIVDFGLGNLFSVAQACAAVGLSAHVTSNPDEVSHADGIILPGVGAIADAMAALCDKKLDVALTGAAADGKLVVGICLGMQLLCSRSEEFGHTEGLGIIDGVVRRLPDGMTEAQGLAAKVPEVGWNAIHAGAAWSGTPLAGTADGEQFYFVHSFFVEPADHRRVLSTTTYGSFTYCSSVVQDNVFGFQFHPERSGPAGLRLYRNVRSLLEARKKQKDQGGE